MYPMDFEEFLIANGLGDDVISNLKQCYTQLTPVDEFVHDKIIEAFYTYLIVGGMPEAVQTYLDSNDLVQVSKVHGKIIREYRKDFTKYEQSMKLKLLKTYDLIPSELNTKNKRYIFTNLDKELRFDRYENSFNWLIDAGVSLPVYNVTEFEIPLEASKKSNLFKLFLSDVGMLTSAYGSATVLRLLEKGKDINCGAMFENAIAQELTAHGYKNYYFNNKKHGEVDFLLEHNNELLPIEVKSGKDYQKHSALSYFMSTRQFNNAIVLSNFNVSQNDKIIYLPIYMIMFIEKIEVIEKRKPLNLGVLSLKKTGQ
jgi:predicted AAA+ superfamily ATPase